MTKKEIQKRVLKNGKPLQLTDFTWDGETNTFSSHINGLVMDFKDIDNCTFDTRSNCIFGTGPNCTFNTWYNCTFNTGPDCTFDTESNCVIIRRDVFQIIQPTEGDKIEIFPYGKKGYLTNGMYNSKPHIIADGIVSEIIQQKGDIYRVKNLGENKITYLIKDGDIYSHGETLKQAREDLVYKLTTQDLSEYKAYTIDTVLSKNDCIKMYRSITGACSSGVKYFVDNLESVKDEYSIKELIELTKGKYNNDRLVSFFKG